MGPGTSIPPGYGGMPTGVVTLDAVRVASPPGPYASVVLPTLSGKFAGPGNALAPLYVPLGDPRPPQLALDLVALAVGDGLLSTTTTAAMQNLCSPDCRRSFSAFFRGPSLQLGCCRAGNVEAPKLGLLHSPSAPHGPRVPCDVPGLDPELYREGPVIRSKTHWLGKLVTRQQRSHKASKEHNTSARTRLSSTTPRAGGPRSEVPKRRWWWCRRRPRLLPLGAKPLPVPPKKRRCLRGKPKHLPLMRGPWPAL